ncbi:MAG: hypothetical protein V2B18_16560 [Pseudomonadota bacterium]
MGKRRVRTVILCEDLQQEVFVYRFLKRTGRANTRTVTVWRSAGGRGSGAQFVLEHFAKEIKAFRAKSSHINLCLVVVIDADNFSVEERIRQLESSLGDSGQQERTTGERIVILVPKRNIETWIRYLDGMDYDETQPYSKLTRQKECMSAVKRLADFCTAGLQTDVPDSLRRACVEARRCDRELGE